MLLSFCPKNTKKIYQTKLTCAQGANFGQTDKFWGGGAKSRPGDRLGFVKHVLARRERFLGRFFGQTDNPERKPEQNKRRPFQRNNTSNIKVAHRDVFAQSLRFVVVCC